tara:strand:+ start:1084 stop:1725 length:642 start_codon:yes stop_codon:yes gene_type:complete
MGSYISSTNNFATKAIFFTNSIIRSKTPLVLISNTTTGYSAEPISVRVKPDGGSFKTVVDDLGLDINDMYSFIVTTDSLGVVTQVTAEYLNPSLAALTNQNMAGETLEFSNAVLREAFTDIPFGTGPSGSGNIEVGVSRNELRPPDSTKFWNNECVTIYAVNKCNVKGTLANDKVMFNIGFPYVSAQFLPIAWKSIQASAPGSDPLNNIVLLQ